MLNVVNGGAHARNSLDLQEFMIVPGGAETFSDGLRVAVEVFHTLKKLLDERDLSTAVGDEGGFAPDLGSSEEAIDVILEAAERAGHRERIAIALDPAMTELVGEDGVYSFESHRHAGAAAGLLGEARRPLSDRLDRGRSGRGGLGGVEGAHRVARRSRSARRRRPVRDERRAPAARDRSRCRQCDPDQGQPDRNAHRDAGGDRARRSAGYASVISHRSGETEDTTIADLVVATGAGQIKAGAPSRSDRVAKYNQLLRIEEELGADAEYPGWDAFPRRS